MARTFVPDPRPVNRRVKLSALLDMIHRDLVMCQGDLDKAGTIEDASYYEGLVEALTIVERLITKSPRANRITYLLKYV